ncbi:hypothetical protein PISL3812_05611 [Talaromyces islandicus]|uniref:Uncharacterized protein n=1 Tax=Talaromyces islandicus TaxID=28573 RepID=A0A0U1M0N6_TALIS|nr:hypothetical protein PISL3812_05611 [Talaromyces islandicus]
MAGTKRKVDNSRSSSSQATAVSESSTQSQTRVPTHGKGTRGSSRLAAPDTPSALSEDHVPSESIGMTPKSTPAAEEQEQPRFKRLRLTHKAAETPKPTRYSTRSKAPTESSTTESPQLSRRQSVEEPSSSQPANNTRRLTRQLSSKGNSFNSADSAERRGAAEDLATPTRKAAATASPSKSVRGRKRPAEDTSKEEATETESSPSTLKKPKLENDEAGSRVSPDGSNTVDGSQNAKTDSPIPISQETPAEEPTDSRATDDINGSMANPTDSGSTPNARGRGTRGRGTGRARGNRGRGRGGARGGGTPLRGSGRGRGRGGRGGGKPGKRGDDDSDFEQERSPSPVPASQRLLDRQKELKQSWKRLAATQRLLLNAIAGRTQNRLVRDKTAHRKVEEFEEVQEELQAALEKRLEHLGNEYRLRLEMENRVLEAQQTIIRDRYEANAMNAREELFYAARGDYMALVEGVRQAEDDEHTEPDVNPPEPAEVADSETGSNHELLYLDEPVFRRGYNSKFLREPSGSASYELGRNDWDEFVQRVKMKEISQEESAPAGPDSLDILLHAVDAVGQAVTSVETGLSALADAASNAQPAPQQHQQPPPPPPPPPMQPPQTQAQSVQTATESPSYLLPRPPPVRPVLPTSYNLPNPFTTGRGPPQLPPPPGVSFSRSGPNLPGFFQGPQQPSQHQYQPGPAPAPGPTSGPGPVQAPYYFPGHPPRQSPPPRHHPY